ncbi:hypothetical protein GCM10023403_27610 [Pseudonocardia benzenivorans]|nr:hypothetical protein PSD17_62590 [Pseudonocardia sp. D17]
MIGAADDDARATEHGEQRFVGVVVGVAGPDRHQRDARRDGSEELPRRVARAVVRHLEDVGLQRHVRGEQIGLGRELDVAGEQHRSGTGLCPHHQRPVVDGGTVVGIDVGRRVQRSEHVDHQRGPAQPPAGVESDDGRPRPRSLRLNPAQRCQRLP